MALAFKWRSLLRYTNVVTTAPAARATAEAPHLSLRERKKLRTRQTLTDAALEAFTRRGFDNVTLDELCEAAEVSKRTFFRYFTSKEDVAMTPFQDLWETFLEELESCQPDGRPLLELLRDTLLAALDRMAAEEGWRRRVLLSHRLSQQNPSIDAHGLHFCGRVTEQAIQILHRTLDLDDPCDPRPRFLGDLLLAAFRYALADWDRQAGDSDLLTTAPIRGGAQLATMFQAAVAAVPASLTLAANPRATGVDASLGKLGRRFDGA